jgi:hypothetical protein
MNKGKNKSISEHLKSIRLDSDFYSLFRNLIKEILEMEKSNEIRVWILRLINTNNMDYYKKLSYIQKLLIECSREHIKFSDFTPEMIKSINPKNIRTCSKDSSNIYCKAPYTVFPNVSLTGLVQTRFNEQPNHLTFYMRLADELIRYYRIREFMFNKTNYYIPYIDYQINDDEAIFNKNTLNQYFSSMTSVPTITTRINTFEQAFSL